MRGEGISDDVPIIMAGGVWYLREWEHWIDNPELGQIAFQFGTRPLLTEESPIPQGLEGPACARSTRRHAAAPLLADGVLQLGGAQSRSCARSRRAATRQIPYSQVRAGEHTVQLDVGVRGKNFWVTPKDRDRAPGWSARASPKRSRPRRHRGVRRRPKSAR
jgi:hypothetical protein